MANVDTKEEFPDNEGPVVPGGGGGTVGGDGDTGLDKNEGNLTDNTGEISDSKKFLDKEGLDLFWKRIKGWIAKYHKDNEAITGFTVNTYNKISNKTVNLTLSSGITGNGSASDFASTQAVVDYVTGRVGDVEAKAITGVTVNNNTNGISVNNHVVNIQLRTGTTLNGNVTTSTDIPSVGAAKGYIDSQFNDKITGATINGNNVQKVGQTLQIPVESSISGNGDADKIASTKAVVDYVTGQTKSIESTALTGFTVNNASVVVKHVANITTINSIDDVTLGSQIPSVKAVKDYVEDAVNIKSASLSTGTGLTINSSKQLIVPVNTEVSSGSTHGQLATSLSVYTAIENVKSHIDDKITDVYHYIGSVATESDLPTTGVNNGDVYNVEDTGMNFAWVVNGDATGFWDALGGQICYRIPDDYINSLT